MVAHAQWAFQVSQGSVDTLFTWGEKRLHHYIANLFGKRCTKFRQHRPSFIAKTTKTSILASFFPDKVYLYHCYIVTVYAAMSWDGSWMLSMIHKCLPHDVHLAVDSLIDNMLSLRNAWLGSVTLQCWPATVLWCRYTAAQWSHSLTLPSEDNNLIGKNFLHKMLFRDIY